MGDNPVVKRAEKLPPAWKEWWCICMDRNGIVRPHGIRAMGITESEAWTELCERWKSDRHDMERLGYYARKVRIELV